MNPRPLLLPLAVFLVLLALFPGGVGAREVRLKKGEVYRERNLTVLCEGGQGQAQTGALGQTMAVRECQYWDDFDKKCLFEKTTYSHGNLECVEECQHWDSFHNTCDYRSKCTFYPRQQGFVLRTCAEFDDYSRKCLKTREEKIGADR